MLLKIVSECRNSRDRLYSDRTNCGFLPMLKGNAKKFGSSCFFFFFSSYFFFYKTSCSLLNVKFIHFHFTICIFSLNCLTLYQYISYKHTLQTEVISMHDTVPEYPISDICLLVINFFFLLEKCFLMEQC